MFGYFEVVLLGGVELMSLVLMMGYVVCLNSCFVEVVLEYYMGMGYIVE